MITFIGDVHAKFNAYREICKQHETTIQVGDFGAGFADLPQVNQNHRFIRGNHDSPEICKASPNWIPDGFIETIDGVKFMFIGGAWSIDAHRRIEGVSWWRDEECSYEQLNRFIDLAINENPDVMVTHTCPLEVAGQFYSERFGKINGTVTGNALQALLNATIPKLWIFGHWHQSENQTIGETRFVCLNELEVVTLNL